MTREEAIKILKARKDCNSDHCPSGEVCYKCDEAFDMAFKALEQEPSTDAVSRQAVKEQMIKYGFNAPDMTVTEFVEDCLPSVTPKQTSWIPCSERLPEKNGNYLVTVESNDGTASIKFQMVDHYGPDWLHEEKPRKVIAWMPLPESYKAESEDSK